MTDIQLGYKLTEVGVILEDWVVKLLFLVPTRRMGTRANSNHRKYYVNYS